MIWTRSSPSWICPIDTRLLSGVFGALVTFTRAVSRRRTFLIRWYSSFAFALGLPGCISRNSVRGFFELPVVAPSRCDRNRTAVPSSTTSKCPGCTKPSASVFADFSTDPPASPG